MTPLTAGDFERVIPNDCDVGIFRHYEIDGTVYVVVGLEAPTKDAALDAVTKILDVVKGRRAFVRVTPEGESQCDFMTNKWSHRGFVRFSYFNEPGEWEYSKYDKSAELRYLPLAYL